MLLLLVEGLEPRGEQVRRPVLAVGRQGILAQVVGEEGEQPGLAQRGLPVVLLEEEARLEMVVVDEGGAALEARVVVVRALGEQLRHLVRRRLEWGQA